MFNRKFFSRIGWLVIVLLIGGAAIYFLGSQLILRTADGIAPSAMAPAIDDFPVVTNKSQPNAVTFNGCPPEGQGGDAEFNALENRVDEGKYVDISFDTLLALRWPRNAERQVMSAWSPQSDAYIEQYQGMPIALTGYILLAKEAPPSPANCNRNNFENSDWNLSIADNQGDSLSQAVIAAVTPRVRSKHKWTIDAIRRASYQHLQVRISGWLLFNPTRPGDVGTSRATLWEIHPVMQIEVLQDGHWVALDKFSY
ncbi:MAG: hypothetical protein M1282_01850 [Chloroflexi bacterium]|nr:hypothetical protein [Chloroflexota bacterium]